MGLSVKGLTNNYHCSCFNSRNSAPKRYDPSISSIPFKNNCAKENNFKRSCIKNSNQIRIKMMKNHQKKKTFQRTKIDF